MAITYTDKVQLTPNPNPVINQWRADDANEVKTVVNVNETTLNNHVANTSNPHGVTATQVGLGNVNNTSDANKPVSTATQTALDLKANIASPTFTGTPSAPTAAVGTDSTQIATTEYVRDNALSNATSFVYPLQLSYQSPPIHSGGIGSKVFEIINTGNPGGSSETRMITPVFVMRHGGNAFLGRNMEWDQANQKWLTPYQQADAYGSVLFEAGGEAAILHATPAGVDFTDVPHEILLASANGTDGETNHKISSGYYTQSKAPFFARFNSTTYNPSSTGNCWNQTSGVDPLLWLSTGETKNTENELMRLEANSNTAAAYPALFFARSHGTLASRTIAVTAEVSGRIGFKAYDGVDYETTAIIQAVTRGTMASNSVGQELSFATSPSTTANLAVRMIISHDGAVKYYVPIRYDVVTITTIPDYTGNGYDPPLSTGTVMQIQPASSVNGGMILQGFTVSGTASASAFVFRGVQGHTAPTGANTQFVALKHNGTTNFTGIGTSEIGFQFRNNTTVLIEVLGSGNTGFGVQTPGAKVQVRSTTNNAVALLVEDDGGNDILSCGESGGARVIGFFGVTPAIRQVVATGSTADQIITALQNLGLFSQT